MRNQAGVTLIELAATLAVAMVLLGASLPHLRGVMAERRLDAHAHRLVTDLKYARTEAIRRNLTVTLRSRSGTDWQNGWDVIGYRGQVLWVADAPQAGIDVQVRSDAGEVSALAFRNSGALARNVDVAMVRVCDATRYIPGREVSVSPTGRLEVRDVACR